MPVFEHDERITNEEFKRQQQQLNDKVFRQSFKRMVGDIDRRVEGDSNGGDCWENEEDE